MAAKLISLLCPSCGAQLEAENDTTYKCPFCGNMVKVQDDHPAPRYQPPPAPRPAPTYRPAYSPSPRREFEKGGAVLFSAIGLLALVIVIALVSRSPSSGTPTPAPAGNAAALAQAEDDDLLAEEEDEVTVPRGADYDIPQSEPLRQFLMEALEKDIEHITPEDIAAIRYLKLGNGFPISSISSRDYRWTIEYSFGEYDPTTGDGSEDIQTIRIPGDEKIAAVDLECFTGLTYLEAGFGNMTGEKDLTFLTMPHLQYMFSDHPNSLNAAMYANPDGLRAIQVRLKADTTASELAAFHGLTHLYITRVDDDFSNFGMLAELKSLTHLYIDANLADISWVSQHTGLTYFEFTGREVSDYTVLYGLPKLEELKITSAGGLRDISFVSSMPNLHALHIESSDIMSIEPLRDMTGLHSLRLYNNHEMKDFGPVSSLTNLKTFRISYISSITNLDLNSHAFLEDVELHAEYIGAVCNNPNVKTLKLRCHAADNNMDVFWNMTGLESLHFDGGNDVDYGLSSLSSLPNLKHLKMTDFFTFTFSPFSMPQLETLELESCTLSPNLGTPPEGTSLTTLAITDCSFYDTGWNRYDGPTNVQGLLGACTSLERLTLNGLKLDSLAFAEHLAALQYLDISDNYISDLAPLVGLENLAVLVCGDNSINTYDILPDSVLVRN